MFPNFRTQKYFEVTCWGSVCGGYKEQIYSCVLKEFLVEGGGVEAFLNVKNYEHDLLTYT
jgi:hypothetical protein